jgi:maltooligosyltrehalose trehalohydrolase
VNANRQLPRSQGAELIDGQVHYRTWAPGKTVEAVVYDSHGSPARTIGLREEGDGYCSAIDLQGRAGDLYKFQFDTKAWPDPASRFNPQGVHGPSEVVDPRSYTWHDAEWTCPPVAELVIYELHIGTFTEEGTFRGAIERLDHVVELGANAIEIMPVAAFPGRRNWGYDGVLLYAPARAYGRPNDLRALVDAAHGHGLSVILDVVYNHLGPSGNYLGTYSRDYFHPTNKTPWGDAFNFELKPVRDFFAENPGYWRNEFHIDGFRLDATHAIVDRSETHFLAEIAQRTHSLGSFVMVEDERNEPKLLQPPAEGGLGLDACWADDFHHVVRVTLTGEREGYYKSYEGTVHELAETLSDGWLFHGEERRRKRNGEQMQAAQLPPHQFVFCVANHDQIGNRAFGEPLSAVVSPAAYRAASALLCLVPYTPLLFMGQEWATATPFQFFTDHEPDLGRRITEGRRKEFRHFAAFHDPATREKIPDPQAEETFLRSRLRWEELERPQHAATLRLYRECLRLRRELPALRDRSRGNWRVLEPAGGIIMLLFGKASDDQCLVLIDLVGGHEMPPLDIVRSWHPLLSTNEARFGGDDPAPFAQPEVRVLRAL